MGETLKGSLIQSKERDYKKNFTTAAGVLNIVGDEDGFPIAHSLMIDNTSKLKGSLVPNNFVKIGFVSVSDGLGGSGSRLITANIDDKPEERTMAYIAARKVQEAARNVMNNNSQVLTGTLEEIRTELQTAIKEFYSTIKYETPVSKIKGKIIREFPTTFSAAVIQETNKEKKVMFFWAGDSPFFIITPDKIFTTYTAGAGDAPVESVITLGNYNLKAKQLEFSANTPILVVAASDGILKLSNSSLESAKEFIINGVKKGYPNQIIDSLKSKYQEIEKGGSLEKDDTTIALVTSMNSEEISRLNNSVPVETI